MPDPIQTGQMVHRTSRRPQGQTLTQQRNALAFKNRPAQRRPMQGQTEMSPEQRQQAIADAKRRSAQQAQQQGMSKSDWLNKLYGTGFFRGGAGQSARGSWGDDWYGGGGGGGGVDG